MNCEISFSRASSLKRHIRIHMTDKPITCIICESSFSRADDLKVHNRTHTREKPYACTICESSFSTASGLKRHERKHTGDKLFTCYLCFFKTFSHSNALIKHNKTHSDEKPFTCCQCSKKLSHKLTLRKHQKVHEIINNESIQLLAAWTFENLYKQENKGSKVSWDVVKFCKYCQNFVITFIFFHFINKLINFRLICSLSLELVMQYFMLLLQRMYLGCHLKWFPSKNTFLKKITIACWNRHRPDLEIKSTSTHWGITGQPIFTNMRQDNISSKHVLT